MRSEPDLDARRAPVAVPARARGLRRARRPRGRRARRRKGRRRALRGAALSTPHLQPRRDQDDDRDDRGQRNHDEVHDQGRRDDTPLRLCRP